MQDGDQLRYSRHVAWKDWMTGGLEDWCLEDWRTGGFEEWKTDDWKTEIQKDCLYDLRTGGLKY